MTKAAFTVYFMYNGFLGKAHPVAHFSFKVPQDAFHTCYQRGARKADAWRSDVMSTGPLLQQRFESTSEEPEVRCCRVYSQISRAALTCTLSERMTPCWGISTHTSNIWSRLAGIPSRSLL